jgi:lysozyme family protein
MRMRISQEEFMGRPEIIKIGVMVLAISFCTFLFIPEIAKHYKKDNSSFEEAIDKVLKEEGGLSDDKDDKGGITKFGISQRFLQGLEGRKVKAQDIRNLTREDAVDIYKKFWWDKYEYGKIDYQPLADKILDISVNMGPFEAALLLEKACKIKRDAFPSSKLSLQLINYINALSEEEKKHILLDLKLLSINYYINIADRNRRQEKFLKGWIKRAEN